MEIVLIRVSERSDGTKRLTKTQVREEVESRTRQWLSEHAKAIREVAGRLTLGKMELEKIRE
jgi:hypothetical protein